MQYKLFAVIVLLFLTVAVTGCYDPGGCYGADPYCQQEREGDR